MFDNDNAVDRTSMSARHREQETWIAANGPKCEALRDDQSEQSCFFYQLSELNRAQRADDIQTASEILDFMDLVSQRSCSPAIRMHAARFVFVASQGRALGTRAMAGSAMD
jgi:hypothetical protein